MLWVLEVLGQAWELERSWERRFDGPQELS